jgi:hypothetical protein
MLPLLEPEYVDLGAGKLKPDAKPMSLASAVVIVYPDPSIR